MASYEEFLAQLRDHCAVTRNNEANKDESKAKVKSPSSVYEELSFDFPLVSAEDLQGLATALLNELQPPTSEHVAPTASVFFNYPIKRKFVQSIVEGASRYNSAKKKDDASTTTTSSPLPSSSSSSSSASAPTPTIDDATASSTATSSTTTSGDAASTTDHDADSALTTAYCTLCAIVYVKMTQQLLKMTNEQRALAMKEFKSHLVATTTSHFGTNDDDVDWNPFEDPTKHETSKTQEEEVEEAIVVQEGECGSDSDYESYDVGQSVSILDVVQKKEDDNNAHYDLDQPPI